MTSLEWWLGHQGNHPQVATWCQLVRAIFSSVSSLIQPAARSMSFQTIFQFSGGYPIFNYLMRLLWKPISHEPYVLYGPTKKINKKQLWKSMLVSCSELAKDGGSLQTFSFVCYSLKQSQNRKVGNFVTSPPVFWNTLSRWIDGWVFRYIDG